MFVNPLDEIVTWPGFEDDTKSQIIERKPIIPLLSPLERAAYQAAHEILQTITDYGERDLVAPGGIRSRRIDRIAKVIMKNMEGVKKK